MRYSAGAAMHALALILSSAQAWYHRVPLQSSVQTELTQVYSSMAGTPCTCKFSHICDNIFLRLHFLVVPLQVGAC
jgi:hypothetical protein